MISTTTREEFLDFAYQRREEFMDSIAAGDVYVVKRFYDPDHVRRFLAFVKDFARGTEASWHPCLDGVPDYHRINDEYQGSWVRARMHGFYFHRFNAHREVFEGFRDVLELKNFLRGAEPQANLESVPSDGVISRIVSHHYPRGGGYIREHIDPHSDFALIQTIVQASSPGSDFTEGGLYMRPSEDAEPIYLDAHSEIGDLMVLTPAVRHGVAPIDPQAELDWSQLDSGRWMILPVVIRSDYNMDPATKPQELEAKTTDG